MSDSAARERRATVTFWVTPLERRLIRRALLRLGGERTDALLGALGLRAVRAERETRRKAD